MHSFLIASKKPEDLLKKANEICSEREIDKFDINLLESEKQIGIADVKKIQSKAYLKPFKSKEKALVIAAILGLTIEAQNALLKLLEEPPNNTIILLLVDSIDSVLPTIRSRCQMILLEETTSENENLSDYLKLIDSIEKAGIGERLKIAQDLSKDKQETIKTIEKIILVLRAELLKNQNNKTLKRIKRSQEIYSMIKNTNVNLRLALENLFLNF
jgi:DNA polymerase III gamma/tau subunit